MELAVLIGAIEFVPAGDRLATRQMHAAMGATHHVSAILGTRPLILPDAATIALEQAVNDPDAQGKEY